MRIHEESFRMDERRQRWLMRVVVAEGGKSECASVWVTRDWANGWWFDPGAQEAVQEVRGKLTEAAQRSMAGEHVSSDFWTGQPPRKESVIRDLAQLGGVH